MHPGETPADLEASAVFEGVVPKCASLAPGVALGVPAIGAEVHVHRVVNRLLLPFGKRACTSARPKSSECPVQQRCDHGSGEQAS